MLSEYKQSQLYFQTLLLKIRELLWTMSPQELATLEKCLCSMEEPDISIQKEASLPASDYQGPVAYTSDFVHRFYANYPSCRQLTPDMISFCSSGKKVDRNERKRERNSHKSSRTRARQERQSERFLSRLTGVEERPRARKRSRKSAALQQCPELSLSGHRPSTDAGGGVNHPDSALPPLYPRVSPGRAAQQSPYRASVDRRHSNFSGRHRSRQACHSRHRTDRINTIVCACGTLNGQMPSNSCIGTPAQHLQESYQRNDQQYSVHDSPYSSARPVYGSPDLPGPNDEFAYRAYLDSARVRVDTTPELSRPNPCILLPVSFGEGDRAFVEGTLSPQPETDFFLFSDFNRLNLAEENPVRINCDDCNNIQSYGCDNTTVTTTATTNVTTCDTAVDQTVNIAYNLGDDESLEKLEFISGCKSGEREERLSNCSACSPQVPEPTHSHRPYGTNVQTLIHSKEDQALVEKTKLSNYELEKSSEDVEVDAGSSGSTSPHHSGTEDDEEVALALQAAEVAASWKARERCFIFIFVSVFCGYF